MRKLERGVSFSRHVEFSVADARSCTTCDRVLQELEQIDDDTDSFGVDFVKINDKRLAKHYGITKFPALTYFREKQPIIYEGRAFVWCLFAQEMLVGFAINTAMEMCAFGGRSFFCI